jgi:hypothetical protein
MHLRHVHVYVRFRCGLVHGCVQDLLKLTQT